MTGWIVLIAVGLGLRHAVAPDHLVAVGTFIEKTSATRRQGLEYAVRIAAGHSVGMLAMAGVMIGLLVAIPAAWLQWMTWGTASWLMLMAVWILWDLGHDIIFAHDTQTLHVAHVSEARKRTDNGRWGALLKRPGSAWLVGLLFGLAVSPGDLAIFTLMAQHHATPWVAFGLLGIFLCSLFAGLGVVGSGLGWANTRVVLRRFFQGLSGVAGAGIALALVTGVLR